jgi:hypothetical protein
VLVDQLNTEDTTALLDLVSGSLVAVRGLPASGPYPDFKGIVEGWTDSYNNGQHILTLSISDPRFSYQTLTWGQVLEDLTWGDVNVAAQWFEIVSNNDLVGA